MMSAELVLAGFMPPKKREMWADDGLRWQPIPVHTLPQQLDEVSVTSTMEEKKNFKWDIHSHTDKKFFTVWTLTSMFACRYLDTLYHNVVIVVGRLAL